MFIAGFWDATIGGLLGSAVTTIFLGLAFLRKNKTVESEVKNKFGQALKVFESQRSWKQQALSELLGPIRMQFDRTKRAMDRWDRKNLYLEAKIVREGNQTIRDLLLAKGHLISPHLIDGASQLIEHYDAWLEAFDRIRGDSSGAESETAFVPARPRRRRGRINVKPSTTISGRQYTLCAT